MLNQLERYTEDDDTSLAEFEAELTRLALAADPDAPLPEDAVPYEPAGTTRGGELLPSWYMPMPAGRPRRRFSRRTRLIVLLLILAFLAIDAYGLCSTYGSITIA